MTSCAEQYLARGSSRWGKRRSAVGLGVAAILAASFAGAAGSSPAKAAAATRSAPSSVLGESARLVTTAESSALTGPSFGPVTAAQAVKWSGSMIPTPAPLVKGAVKVDVVYGIPVGSVPYAAHLLVTIGAKLGWKVKVVQASAQTQQANLTAFQQALLDKPQAIIGLVVPGVWVGSALSQAKSEGIVTVDIHQDQSTGPGYDAWVPDAEGIQKSLLAAFAVQQSGGTANTILFNAPGFSDADMPAAQQYLVHCAKCSTSTKQLNPTDFTNPVAVQSDVSAELAANPKAGYLMWPNGSLPIQSVITAIAASPDKKSKLLIDGPAPQGLQLVANGDIPGAVITPDALLSLTAIDDVSRLLQKKPPLAQTALRIPVTLVTKANLPSDANFSTYTQALLKNNFLTPFNKAWHTDLRSAILSVKA